MTKTLHAIYDGQAFKKGSAIFIVPKDFSAFNSPCHYVLQDTGGIKSGLAWHRFYLFGQDKASL